MLNCLTFAAATGYTGHVADNSARSQGLPKGCKIIGNEVSSAAESIKLRQGILGSKHSIATSVKNRKCNTIINKNNLQTAKR